MPKEQYDGKVTWYRLESSKVVFSTLTQTNNKYITCCKFTREEQANHTVRIVNKDVAKELGSISHLKKNQYKISDNNYKGEDLEEIKIDIKEISKSDHLVTSKDSPMISGGISAKDGDALFQSTYFHGKPSENKITNGNNMLTTSPPIFLRVRMPVDRLVKISGGDTVVTGMGDVPTLGALEKPGFIPVEWVDRISWIVDTSMYDETSKELIKKDSGFDDVRQYTTKKELAEGVLFSTEPKFLLEALNRLNKVTWIKSIDTDVCSINSMLKNAQARSNAYEALKKAINDLPEDYIARKIEVDIKQKIQEHLEIHPSEFDGDIQEIAKRIVNKELEDQLKQKLAHYISSGLAVENEFDLIETDFKQVKSNVIGNADREMTQKMLQSKFIFDVVETELIEQKQLELNKTRQQIQEKIEKQTTELNTLKAKEEEYNKEMADLKEKTDQESEKRKKIIADDCEKLVEDLKIKDKEIQASREKAKQREDKDWEEEKKQKDGEYRKEKEEREKKIIEKQKDVFKM